MKAKASQAKPFTQHCCRGEDGSIGALLKGQPKIKHKKKNKKKKKTEPADTPFILHNHNQISERPCVGS
jgi:hypothetical protein